MAEPRDTYKPAAILAVPTAFGPTVVVPLLGPNGGMADAVYFFTERRESSGKWLYRLHHIDEWMPPRPPQIQGYGDDMRLPMMENGYFSATLEAEQRRKEWAEIQTGIDRA